MHYIRFLKQPRLIPHSTPNPTSPAKVSAKIVITTDLGETFLLESIPLLAHLELEQGASRWVDVASKEVRWTSRDGYTGLEIGIPLPRTQRGNKGNVRMTVRAKEAEMTCESLDRLPGEVDEGSVVSVCSMAVDLSNKNMALGPALAERVFYAAGKEIHIWEETGESIARHIWDAGLVLSSYLSSFSPSHTTSPNRQEMNHLSSVLQKGDLKVLELGAGCGIVGITLTTLFPNISHTLLTDLPEATSILSHNLSISLPTSQKRISHQVLDWSLPLSTNVSATPWDLVVVADCTYNPDVVPDLVKTLQRLVVGKKVEEQEGPLVLLAMKVRHDSEMVFFELMAQQGFLVRESMKIDLPLLGGEGEEIEVFGFVYCG